MAGLATPPVDPREASVLVAARNGDHDAFGRLTGRYYRELQIHCYRMLGSMHDAEDAVQDTLLRAWQRLDSFEGRSPLRAWLYKIATNACLNELKKRPRLLAPRSLGPPGQQRKPRAAEVTWLEPYPDVLLDEIADSSADPQARYDHKESVALAFLAAIQFLPPRQRAVLILRDVLGWSAKEAAELLETTGTAVNSALQRARATLGEQLHEGGQDAERVGVATELDRLLQQRFVAAWEATDVDGLVALLKQDAVLTMPPTPLWYRGRRAIASFFSTVPAGGALDRIRLLPTRANRQPALAAYIEDVTEGVHSGYGLMVLTLAGEAIGEVTAFPDPRLLAFFGLPAALEP